MEGTVLNSHRFEEIPVLFNLSPFPRGFLSNDAATGVAPCPLWYFIPDLGALAPGRLELPAVIDVLTGKDRRSQTENYYQTLGRGEELDLVYRRICKVVCVKNGIAT
jgi:hypothetical protein